MNAQLIIQNASVYTLDPAAPWAEAVAIAGNRIIYVGDNAGVAAYIGPESRVLDGEGRTLMPGIIDTHFHLLWGSHSLYGAPLRQVESLGDLQAVLTQWMEDHPDAPVIVGEGITYGVPDKETPLTRHHLDQIEADKPIVLTAFDQHSCFANTKALEMAGLLQGSPTPLSAGEIVMGEDGLATGELYEMDAMMAIKAILPKLSAQEEEAVLQQGLALVASYGITSIHNMDGNRHQAQLYADIEARGELSLRIYMPLWVKPEMSEQDMLDRSQAILELLNGEMVRGGVVKFFMDGVYESHTALSVNGFADRPGEHGEPIWPHERFVRFASLADEKGYQIVVHAVGDGAVRQVLDGYQQVQSNNGERDSRHRIEHIELIQSNDVPRFVELGVVSSMQPLHGTTDGELWQTRVDPAEYDRAFAWRTLRESGATLVFGSDWPVVTCNPYQSIAAAMLRKPMITGGAEHQQTLEESLQAYTRDAAWVEFQEGLKGEIRTGLLADLVLLSHDIFTLSPSEIASVNAALTICDGRIVFERHIP